VCLQQLIINRKSIENNTETVWKTRVLQLRTHLNPEQYYRKLHTEELYKVYISGTCDMRTCGMEATQKPLKVRFADFYSYSSFSLCVQTSAEAHPVSYPIGTGVLSGGKARPGPDTDHSSPSSAELRMSRSYNPLPLSACMVCSGMLS
jgi:hypothetical protein